MRAASRFLMLFTLLTGTAGAGLIVYQWTLGPVVAAVSATSFTVNDVKANKKPLRPEFSLADVQGKTHSIREWDGKIILLNFWATWCPPCQREMPAFVKLQDKYGKLGFQIIGVAIDQKQAVLDFADSIGVNYPMLIGELDAVDVAKRYGNERGQLPYSVIIDQSKRVILVKRGEITHEEIEKVILTLLPKTVPQAKLQP